VKEWHQLLPLSVEMVAKIAGAEELSSKAHREIDKCTSYNQVRVLEYFRQVRLGEEDFSSTTGYGYNDAGRDKLEALYSLIFGGERALVRPQLVSGTHAISCCLFGLLRPGDKVLAVTGVPYDTLHKVIGRKGEADLGTLLDFGIDFQTADLVMAALEGDAALTRSKLEPFLDDKKIKLIYIQRSRGYSLRPALTLRAMGFLIRVMKDAFPHSTVFVDNCYGEFVEDEEPLHVGADLLAGSLIKNPGGTLAPSGGYVVGKESLIEQVAGRLTAPGLGSALGPTLGTNRPLLQGLFLAPHFVGEALKSAVFAAALFTALGYEAYPRYDEKRGDIVQALALGNRERLEKFCQAIQAYSPVDSHALPVAGVVPGYERQIIMAAGTFVQGSSLELSADAPMVPPYAVYLQGGVIYPHARAAIGAAAAALLK
jgi:cystathionine beta-lyase family protein involved in aluminum resistance